MHKGCLAIYRGVALTNGYAENQKEMPSLMRARTDRQIEKLISRHMIRGKNILKRRTRNRGKG